MFGSDLESGKKAVFKIKTPPKIKLLFIKYENKAKKLPEKQKSPLKTSDDLNKRGFLRVTLCFC